MVNNNGIIQNNSSVSEFVKNLKNNKIQYKTLTKREERCLIEKYVKENKEDDLRELLMMHNIRLVFSIAKKYCKKTIDFDNMFAKGLYGLVYAANKFNLFEPVKIKVKVGSRPVLDEFGKPMIDPETGFELEENVYVKKIKIDPETCQPEYVKFCTYANSWIFKYIVDEFSKKSLKIDNKSISIDDDVRIKNSTDNKYTVENFIDGMISREYHQKTINESIDDDEVNYFYGTIGDYLVQTNELTALEKQIVIDTYYNNKKLKEIAEETSEKPQNILNKKNSALKKIRKYLKRQFNITEMKDFKK